MATNPLLDDPALNQAAKAIKSGNPLLSDPALDAAVAAAKAGAEKKAPAQTVGRLGGMTARNLIEGAAGAVGAITDPFVMAMGGAVRSVTGNDYDPVTMNKIGQSIADALGLPQAETGAERVSSALQKGLLSGGGFAGLAGQVAGRTSGATQAAAAGLAAQPALQAVAGAGAGAGGQLAAEAGAGPGTQIAASLAGGLGAAGASGALQRAARVPGAVVDPAQQAILDAGTANNVPVLTSDVLPPNSFMSKSLQSMGERIPVAGTGPVRATQQAAREGSVANIAAQYGTPDYEAIVGSVKGRIGGIKKAAGRVINQAGAELDTYGTAVPTKTIRTIDDAITDLSRPEVYKPGYQGYINDLTELKNSFTPQTTYSNLRETRTALRESMESVDPFGRSQLPSKTKALYAKAYSALKNDMDDFAALNLPPDRVAKLNRANVVYGETAGLLKNTRLKNILDKGDVTPEVVKGIVFNGQPSEMNTLYDALSPIGRQNVRAAVIDDAVTKSVLANGEINPNRFGAELAKKEKNVSAFFRGDDRDAVRGLTRLLQVTRRGQDASLAPTNGSSAIPYALGAGAIADLGITLSTAAAGGGLARVYESAPVRNLLLKLANVPRNTAQEGELVRKLAVSIRTEQQRQENSQQATPQQ